MTHLSRITAFAQSTALLGFVIAGCQPQGGVPTNQTTESAAAEATAADEPINVITGSEQVDLLVGNTLIGSLHSFKLTWAEYFSPDGTTRALLRFVGEDDLEVTGTYFTDDQDRLCTEYAEMEQKFGQTVFCNMIVSLGEGKYQQLWDDGTRGAIYEQILEGEQLHALDAVAQVMTVAEMTDLLVGNTVMGTSHAWNMTWSEFFAPDGTVKIRYRFEDQDDVGEGAGAYYFDANERFCTDYPETPDGPYCSWILPLGNGKYVQVYDQPSVGETSGSIYEQVLEGDQVEAFK